MVSVYREGSVSHDDVDVSVGYPAPPGWDGSPAQRAVFGLIDVGAGIIAYPVYRFLGGVRKDVISADGDYRGLRVQCAYPGRIGAGSAAVVVDNHDRYLADVRGQDGFHILVGTAVVSGNVRGEHHFECAVGYQQAEGLVVLLGARQDRIPGEGFPVDGDALGRYPAPEVK